jgi:peptide/nickel transport system permease protein
MMVAHLARRALFAVFLVLAVSSAALVLTRLAPGDYATDALGLGAREETVERTRARLGLDRPFGAQYREWLGRAVRFDFGSSLAYQRPVAGLVGERAANSALLALSALAVATLVGLPLGIITGTHAGGIGPALVRAASVLLLSMPPLLTSLALVFVAARTGWLPIGGMTSSGGAPTGTLVDLARHMILPVLALALPIGAMFERLQAQAMHEVMHQPFVLAARARGVPRRRLIWRGGLKAALRPITSVYGLIVGTLLSGSFIVEIVTSWPGLGQLTLNALRARDVYLVAGCAAAGSAFLAAGTLISDAALALVDPRASE